MDDVLLKCLTEIECWHVKPVAVSEEITQASQECNVNLFCRKLRLSTYIALKCRRHPSGLLWVVFTRAGWPAALFHLPEAGSGQEQHHRLHAQTRDVSAPANLPAAWPQLWAVCLQPGGSHRLPRSLQPGLTGPNTYTPTSVPESLLRRTSMWHRST